MLTLMSTPASPSRHARPLWGYSIEDFLSKVRGKEWGILQLGWLDIIDARLYKDPQWQSQRRAALVQRKFAYGAMAYVISRTGMKNVLDLFFEPSTGAGDVMTRNIGPLLEGRFLTVEAHLARVPYTYISVPSIFITEAEDSTISTTIGQGVVALASRMRASGPQTTRLRGQFRDLPQAHLPRIDPGARHPYRH